MRHTILSSMLLAAACTVQGGKNVPVVTGQGAIAVDPATQTVKIDADKVPVLENCTAGQIVRRSATGWECASSGIEATTLAGYSVSATPAPGKILVLDSGGRVPPGALPTAIDATSLGGVPPSQYALKSDLPAVAIGAGTPSLLDTDGDGQIDATILPAGLFRNRILDGRSLYWMSNGGSRVAARELMFLKKSSPSLLEITAYSSMGPHMNGTHSTAAVFEMDLDGKMALYSHEHQSNGGTGWRIWPRTYQRYIQDLPAGVHQLKFDYRLDYANNYYHQYYGSEVFEVRELPAGEKRGLKFFTSDIRTSAASFTGVQDRGLTYQKQGGTNVPLLVTVHDVWGSSANAEASNTGCQWDLFVDSSRVGRDVVIHHDNDDGWLAFPSTVGWIVTGLAAGAHSFDLRVYMHPRSSQCMNGWGSWGHMSVLELDPDRTAHAKDFADVSTSSGTFGDVAGRSVSYAKKEDATKTELRISYMDNTGYNYGSHSYGCRWQVLANGAIVGEAAEHTAAIGGWRLKPTLMTFVARGLDADSDYTIKVQAMQGAASLCRMGWYAGNGASGASNYLLVEEVAVNN